jgi:hypothetical protein
MKNSGEGRDVFADHESLATTLDGLYHTSRRVLRKTAMNTEDIRQLADYVTQVRVLLAELEQLETGSHCSETALSAISGLKQRYLELEGMVKEARNNLHRRGPFSGPTPL